MWLEDTKIPQGNCKLGFEGKAQDPPTAPALARLAQDEESGLCGGDARSGGRLGGITRRKREIVGLRNERVRSVFLEIHPLTGTELRALRRLQREQKPGRYVFMSSAALRCPQLPFAGCDAAWAGRQDAVRHPSAHVAAFNWV